MFFCSRATFHTSRETQLLMPYISLSRVAWIGCALFDSRWFSRELQWFTHQLEVYTVLDWTYNDPLSVQNLCCWVRDWNFELWMRTAREFVFASRHSAAMFSAPPGDRIFFRALAPKWWCALLNYIFHLRLFWGVTFFTSFLGRTTEKPCGRSWFG